MDLAKQELRAFWLGELDSPNSDRQALAVLALGKLPQDPATTAKVRSLVNDKSPLDVVANSIAALYAWDPKANADVFKRAQGIQDRKGRIKRAADAALK